MTEVSFRINAVPIAQPRQRHRIAQTADGATYVKNYVPERHPVQDFKASVRKACADAYTGAPLEGPLALDLLFVLPRPKYLCWRKKPMPRQWCPARPDFDNLAKAVCDALSALLWRDDIQLADVRVQKFVAGGMEAPHVEVLCRTLEERAPAPAESTPLFAEEA